MNWRDWELGLCGYNIWWVHKNNMKDIKYKVRHIRMNDKTWDKLKKERKRSNLSWNLFLVKLLEVNQSL